MAFRTVYEWQIGCLREIEFEDLRPGMIAVMDEPDGSGFTSFFLVMDHPRALTDGAVPGNAEVCGLVLAI